MAVGLAGRRTSFISAPSSSSLHTGLMSLGGITDCCYDAVVAHRKQEQQHIGNGDDRTSNQKGSSSSRGKRKDKGKGKGKARESSKLCDSGYSSSYTSSIFFGTSHSSSASSLSAASSHSSAHPDGSRLRPAKTTTTTRRCVVNGSDDCNAGSFRAALFDDGEDDWAWTPPCCCYGCSSLCSDDDRDCTGRTPGISGRRQPLERYPTHPTHDPLREDPPFILSLSDDGFIIPYTSSHLAPSSSSSSSSSLPRPSSSSSKLDKLAITKSLASLLRYPWRSARSVHAPASTTQKILPPVHPRPERWSSHDDDDDERQRPPLSSVQLAEYSIALSRPIEGEDYSFEAVAEDEEEEGQGQGQGRGAGAGSNWRQLINPKAEANVGNARSPPSPILEGLHLEEVDIVAPPPPARFPTYRMVVNTDLYLMASIENLMMINRKIRTPLRDRSIRHSMRSDAREPSQLRSEILVI